MDAYYLRAGYDHVRHPGGGSHSRFVEHRVSGSGESDSDKFAGYSSLCCAGVAHDERLARPS
jgi:hypothetical protein